MIIDCRPVYSSNRQRYLQIIKQNDKFIMQFKENRGKNTKLRTCFEIKIDDYNEVFELNGNDYKFIGWYLVSDTIKYLYADWYVPIDEFNEIKYSLLD